MAESNPHEGHAGHLVVTFGDGSWEYDPDSLLMSEFLEIKRVTGMTRRDWQAQLAQHEPEAVQALIWLLRKRTGDEVRITEVDGTWSTFGYREFCETCNRFIDEDEPDSEGEQSPTPPVAVVA